MRQERVDDHQTEFAASLPSNQSHNYTATFPKELWVCDPTKVAMRHSHFGHATGEILQMPDMAGLAAGFPSI